MGKTRTIPVSRRNVRRELCKTKSMRAKKVGEEHVHPYNKKTRSDRNPDVSV